MDLDVVAQGFGHVVHRERGHGYGGERFHFHTGFMAHGHFGADVQADSFGGSARDSEAPAMSASCSSTTVPIPAWKRLGS